jgi:hypothetical protein
MSGTEVQIEYGEITTGAIPGSRRCNDLRRDSRVAIHSHTVDPPDEDPGAWAGDAKMTGRAVEIERHADWRAELFRWRSTRWCRPGSGGQPITWSSNAGRPRAD